MKNTSIYFRKFTKKNENCESVSVYLMTHILNGEERTLALMSLNDLKEFAESVNLYVEKQMKKGGEE